MSIRRTFARGLFVSASLGAALAVFPSVALAHVGVDATEIVAGESTTLTFSVSHGCGDSPTTSMRFQAPDGVLNLTPQAKPGWTITTEREDLDEAVESGHGEPQTDRVAVVTYTAEAGNEVPNGIRDSFPLSFRAPETLGQLDFKIVQGCATGENAWIEVWDGAGDEPDSPAPSVMVVAAADEPTPGEEPPADADADDGGSNGLAVVALIVGAVGVIVGGVALVRSRAASAG